VKLSILGKELINIERRSGEVSSIKNPKEWVLKVFGGESFSGMNVTPDTALTFSAVWACVRILSNSLAMVPLNVIQDINGNKTIAKKHPVHYLIHKEPNSMMGSFTFRQSAQAQAVLRGNSYSLIKRNGANRPIELQLISEPNDVEPFIYHNQLFYKINGYKLPFPANDVLHIKGLSFDGIKGKSVLTVARESIGTSLAIQKYGGNIFSSGGAKRIALTSPKTVNEDVQTRLKKSWKKKYGNNDNTNNLNNINDVAFLEGGLDIKEIGMNPEDAQFVASSEHKIEDVARWFGMALHLIQSQKRPTYASVEQQAIEFVTYSLMPWYRTWEEEIDRKLFRKDEKLDFYSKFNLTALLRGDAKARSQFYKDMFNIGVFNRDEIRALEDKNKIDGGETYYLQQNLAPADKLGEIMNQKYGKNGNTN